MAAHRGFAAMDPEKMRALSSKGGLAARDNGTARRWTPIEAALAGRAGGTTTQARRRAAKARAKQDQAHEES